MANPTLVILDAGKTTGTSVTASQVSQQTSIPVTGIGKGPMGVQLIATALVHVKLGSTSAITASLSDFAVGTTPVNLVTKGISNIAYLADSSTATINIGLLESY